MTHSEDLPDIWKMNLGRKGMYEEKCLEEGFIRIGFDIHEDLSGKDHKAIGEIVDGMPGLKEKTKRNRALFLDMFCNRMKVHDLVAVVLKKQRGYLAIGRVIGDYTYQGDIESMPHVRKVEWVYEAAPLSPHWDDLVHMLQSVGTILPIKNEETRERLRHFVDSGTISDDSRAVADLGNDEPTENQLVLEEVARAQIASLIDERFPDKRMEELVASVLRAAGYATAPAVDGADQGVDVIAGGGPLGFEEPRICVQVKHQSKRTDAATVQQLVGAVKQFGAKQGLFVSWGGYTSEAERESRKCFFRIRLWDANDLIDAVCEHYANLPDEIRAAIPLRQVWTVVPEPIDE